MKNYLIILLIFTTGFANAQHLPVTLHPAIGDTIDQIEKKKFLLFPVIADSVFDYGTLFRSNDTLFFNVVLKDRNHYLFVLNDSTLIKYHEQVERLNEFYNQSAKSASDDKYNGPLKTESIQKISPLVTPMMRLQISKDARVSNRVKEDEMRMDLYRRGLNTELISIDW
jgi:hypothetical protein